MLENRTTVFNAESLDDIFSYIKENSLTVLSHDVTVHILDRIAANTQLPPSGKMGDVFRQNLELLSSSGVETITFGNKEYSVQAFLDDPMELATALLTFVVPSSY